MATGAADAQFLRSLIPSLPAELAQRLRSICSSNSENEKFLENFVRLIAGADCTSDSPAALRDQWSGCQSGTRQVLSGLLQPLPNGPEMANGTLKRSHDDVSSEGSKRQRLSPQSSTVAGDEPAQFTLHAISTTSPVRKKVDISIRESSITFTNPTTGSVEATVPLTSLRRAFLLPTRGKTKAHWTVVLLSSDTTEKSTAKGAANDSPQIIFGLDATTAAPLTITKQGGEKEVIAKGSPVLPAIRSFLSSLPGSITQLEPSTDVFKSSVNQFGSTVKSASTTGVPGVEAYRAAKVGSLWFMKEGLLWGESKPCEFWALEDLLGPSEALG